MGKIRVSKRSSSSSNGVNEQKNDAFGYICGIRQGK